MTAASLFSARVEAPIAWRIDASAKREVAKGIGMNETNPPPAPQIPPARKDWGWMGYFAFLLIASVGVAGFMIWFNLSIQLKPEEVEAAQTLWKEKGPKSYDLIFRKRLGISGQEDIFAVKVRDRKVER